MLKTHRHANVTVARARQTRGDLLLLHDVARQTIEVDSPREATRFALERLAAAHEWGAAHAFLLRTEPTPRLQSARSLWRCSAPERFRDLRTATLDTGYEIGEGLVGTVANEKEPRWIENATTVRPAVRPGSTVPLGVRSGMLVPVVVGNKLPAVAVLEFYSAERRRVSAAKLHVGGSLAVLLSGVFQRAQTEQLLADSREAQARRIGRELHDSISQELTGITLMAERLVEQLQEDGSPQAEQSQRMTEYLSRTRSKVHALSRGLLPIEIESHGLRTALDYLVASTAEVHGIECRLDCANDIDTGNKVLTNHLVRIAQESIQNAVKHAGTEAIDVAVTQQGDRITLTVTDYGSGFVANRDGPGVGLRLMRHRAATIGAELSVVSKPGKGTRVRCECRL